MTATKKLKCSLEQFAICLSAERYYDAHEVLEELWYPRRFEDSNEIRLLKGFINASVSFELAKREKHQQSKKVWKNYLKYRPLVLKVHADNLNIFYQTSRYIEKIRLSF